MKNAVTRELKPRGIQIQSRHLEFCVACLQLQIHEIELEILLFRISSFLSTVLNIKNNEENHGC